MPYVPPHVRAAQAAGGAGQASVVRPDLLPNRRLSRDYSRDYRDSRAHDHAGGHGSFQRTGGESPTGFSNGFPGKDGVQTGPRKSEARGLSIPEIVWPKWQPSERIRRLLQEQVAEVRARLNVEVEITPGTAPAPPPVESFADMCLHPSIMQDIALHEYRTPTPIQSQAMPVALCGRDLLGCAETGSGKTAAFALPMIQHCLNQPLLRHGDGPLALVLAPTRELAQQIEREVKAFSLSLGNFKTAIVVGGTNIGEQRADLRSGVHIVVATPGRFIDHLQQGNSSLTRVSFVVLDEADRMLDMGFEPQIREVMRNLPKEHQTLLFSATMPEEIEALSQVSKNMSTPISIRQLLYLDQADVEFRCDEPCPASQGATACNCSLPSCGMPEMQEYLNAPVRVKVGRVSSPTSNVTQVLEKVSEDEKIDTLLALLVDEAAHAGKVGQGFPLTIVFVERKARCDEVTMALTEQGLKAAALHGGRSQNERESALGDFRKGYTNILVATDVASRGLDVTGVGHVVNLDLPKTMEDYVHRIGRTGRAGATGRATSFYADRDAFLVAQIRRALTEAESGNALAFATGKAARRKEREQAAAFREGRLAPTSVVQLGATTVRVDDKYKHMLVTTTQRKEGEGAADDAWDD